MPSSRPEIAGRGGLSFLYLCSTVVFGRKKRFKRRLTSTHPSTGNAIAASLVRAPSCVRTTSPPRPRHQHNRWCFWFIFLSLCFHLLADLRRGYHRAISLRHQCEKINSKISCLLRLLSPSGQQLIPAKMMMKLPVICQRIMSTSWIELGANPPSRPPLRNSMLELS